MGDILSRMFTFKTVKYVKIANPKIGVTQRILQVLILIYILCWVMVYEKSYQEEDIAKCTVTTKLKGIGHTDAELVPGIGKRIWDVADFVIPPLEKDAIFVATNLIVTSGQKQGTCFESEHGFGDMCLSDMECNQSETNRVGNGIPTGRCVLAPGASHGQCEILSWCPLENDTLPFGVDRPTFPMVQNYTLLIKNDIIFEKFKVRRRNIQEWASKRFLGTCLYDRNHEEYKYCPIFKLSTIFEEARVDPTIFIYGGVIGIDIRWNCDLDWNVRYCNPVYSFSRLDDPNANIATGFNFRYANFYQVNGTLHRDLIKAYGIRFVIHAHGRAGKFHIIPLTMHLGSGLALLGLAPTLCDIIVLNLLPSRNMYHKAKFEFIEEEQAKLANRRAGRLTRSERKASGQHKLASDLDYEHRKHKQSLGTKLFRRKTKANEIESTDPAHASQIPLSTEILPDLGAPVPVSLGTSQ
ncbi:P2X purinoceptor [Fasciola hepatica]|uniref:P2X purinoceptor n=1 Tax=Fasciola hepatica TaxID=6192 RepID=A0A4E0RZQ1_FASHE|nr:P2X purinoceptor [Fasciola hepatica]